MRHRKWKISFALLIALALVFALGVIPGCAPEVPPTPPTPPTPTPPTPTPPTPTPEVKWEDALPKLLTITAYDVGSSGYVQAGAAAEGLMKKYGIKVRAIPSGTAIGRLMPLFTGTAKCANCGDESYFAWEGLYECHDMGIGPQLVRQVTATPYCTTLALTKVSGIKTWADLKGKRVAWIPGASTLNVKSTAILAFGDLTWDDVERVEFPSYSASLKGLIEGKCDACIVGITASLMYEAEASPRGLVYLPYPHADKEAWARMLAVTPWLGPCMWDEGPTLTKGKPQEMWCYRYPNMITFEKTPVDEVYALVRALDEAWPLYKDIAPAMSRWRPEKWLPPGVNCPYHEGAIKYFKELGIWKAEHDAIQAEMLAHEKEVQALWKATVEEALEKGIKGKEFPKFWLEKREAKGWMVEI